MSKSSDLHHESYIFTKIYISGQGVEMKKIRILVVEDQNVVRKASSLSYHIKLIGVVGEAMDGSSRGNRP